ncbi:MAG: hypothetical protein HC850_16630 [Rhodomicrobium sp.]|nr:hypothetical protein [Rhodomicrobium sp.]
MTILRSLLVLLALATVSACASLQRDAVPTKALAEIATPIGLSDIRSWGDVGPPDIDARARENIELFKSRHDGAALNIKPYEVAILSLSIGVQYSTPIHTRRP